MRGVGLHLAECVSAAAALDLHLLGVIDDAHGRTRSANPSVPGQNAGHGQGRSFQCPTPRPGLGRIIDNDIVRASGAVEDDVAHWQGSHQQ